ncbi:HEAT repeat domain-containing protein [candidate division WOR-3 bacterium]|nr:HEAT repeat domain-containing protein [candidate division WOR-3 bacterium]
MKIKFKQDKDTILKLLKTANIKRKLRILDKMNSVNEKDSIKILLKILEDYSWTLREKAAYKLAEYGKKVVPRLKKLINRGYWFSRAAACITLGEIGDIKSLDSIIHLLLFDDNPTVTREASTALVKIARQDPLRFSRKLKHMSLDELEMLKIFIILETNDTEIYSVIKEFTQNE